MLDDPFELVRSLADLTKSRFATPGGKQGKPFQVVSCEEDRLTLRTSKGGRVSLRAESFQVAEQILRDLGKEQADGWVPLSDPILDEVLRGENRDNACTSYVFPLLEAIGRVEIDRGRPVRLRLKVGSGPEAAQP